jgi:hypothetical protein
MFVRLEIRRLSLILWGTQAQAEAKAAETAAKAAAASVRYDKDRVKDMFKSSKLLDPKSKEYQEVCLIFYFSWEARISDFRRFHL